VKRYDPDTAPPPAQWLALDEQGRIMLAERYHRRAGIPLPNAKAHATIHVIVENQLALALAAVVETLERLRAEGLDRHEAIHAIGSVLAEHLVHLMRDEPGPGDPNIAYEAALRDLTAERWRAG
jgi:hypothetical protein